MSVVEMNLEVICRQFLSHGRVYSYQPFGKGHINDTFLVAFSSETGIDSFVLQQINRNIFPRPQELMHNIVTVTRALKEKIRPFPGINKQYVPLTVIPTREGKWWYEDKKGRAWRMYNYIANSYSIDKLTSCSQAYEVAKMFGVFQKCVEGLNPEHLFMTIPHFHDASYRLDHFKKVLQKDPCQRKGGAKKEIDTFFEHEVIFKWFEKKLQTNKVPVRITHNDTKVNNVLLNRDTDNGMSVIDLDTVMPGYSLYDFGDLVRTGSCPADEDEPDLDRVYVDKNLYQKLVEGYLAYTKSFLTETEISMFPLAGKYITLIMAMRFLTDYLEGDRYYKVHRPHHNLERCRAQLALVHSLLENQQNLEEITRSAYSTANNS